MHPPTFAEKKVDVNDKSKATDDDEARPSRLFDSRTLLQMAEATNRVRQPHHHLSIDTFAATSKEHKHRASKPFKFDPPTFKYNSTPEDDAKDEQLTKSAAASSPEERKTYTVPTSRIVDPNSTQFGLDLLAKYSQIWIQNMKRRVSEMAEEEHEAKRMKATDETSQADDSKKVEEPK